jgi:hypothetical protein
MLDDSEINSRVQIAMLLDDGALALALFRKYQDLTKQPFAESRQALDIIARITRENIEKFFLCHLRLPPVDEAGLLELMERCVRPLISPLDLVHPSGLLDLSGGVRPGYPFDSTDDDDASEGVFPSFRRMLRSDRQGEGRSGSFLRPDRMAFEDEARNVILNAPIAPDDITLGPFRESTVDGIDKEFLANGSILTLHERIALRSIVPELLKSTYPGTWGPRAIRSFIVRYELARMLLVKVGVKVPPMELANALAHAYNKAEWVHKPQSFDTVLWGVVSQVS